MRILQILFLFILTSLSAFAKERPKVAVVLSGGGAKGVAHVRALRVIEEAGIPIDYIVGTSMGSIVGGLYASGYTIDQMEDIISGQNWMDLLTDKVDRSSHLLSHKLMKDKYVLGVDFEKSPFEILEGGLLKGNNISYLFCELTADRLKPMKYDDLPIPFACVAADIRTGKEVVMREGILAESMRTSMAIPGVFAPVKRDGMVLVDGGIVNNYPVDVARKMGADIVIGVSVAGKRRDYEQINSTVDVLLTLMDGVICSNKVEENIENTDIFIKVNTDGYSSASFTSQAIDSLLARGEAAARGKYGELLALRDSLATYGKLPNIERTPKVLDVDTVNIVPPSTIYNLRDKQSFVGIGARFDNEELASILLGGEYEFNHKNHFRVGLEARLGKRLEATAFGRIDLGSHWNMELRYWLTRNDFKVYNMGTKIANIEYTKNRAKLNFSYSSKKLRFDVGTQFSYTHYPDLLTYENGDLLNQEKKNERAVSYFLSLQYDNQDRRLLPTRGMKWFVKYNFVTDNGYKFNGGRGFSLVEGYWRMALPLSSTTILNPFIEGRYIEDRNTYISNYNMIGGMNTFGHYISQQLSFAGINYVQMVPNALIIGGMNLRQHITTNNYLFLQGNYACTAKSPVSFFTKKHLVGAAIGYGYRSPVGPIEFNFNWSNVTRKLGVFLNIGYMF